MRIFVVVEGGAVQSVYADSEELAVRVIDHDNLKAADDMSAEERKEADGWIREIDRGELHQIY